MKLLLCFLYEIILFKDKRRKNIQKCIFCYKQIIVFDAWIFKKQTLTK